jgi:hypothetical protein
VRRRLLVCVGVALGTLAAAVSPAWACEEHHSGRDWGCVYVEHIDVGYCQQNPLPQELPLPPSAPTPSADVPPAPEAPALPAAI